MAGPRESQARSQSALNSDRVMYYREVLGGCPTLIILNRRPGNNNEKSTARFSHARITIDAEQKRCAAVTVAVTLSDNIYHYGNCDNMTTRTTAHANTLIFKRRTRTWTIITGIY